MFLEDSPLLSLYNAIINSPLRFVTNQRSGSKYVVQIIMVHNIIKEYA